MSAIRDYLLAHVRRTVAQVLRHCGTEEPVTANRHDRQVEWPGRLLAALQFRRTIAMLVNNMLFTNILRLPCRQDDGGCWA